MSEKHVFVVEEVGKPVEFTDEQIIEIVQALYLDGKEELAQKFKDMAIAKNVKLADVLNNVKYSVNS